MKTIRLIMMFFHHLYVGCLYGRGVSRSGVRSGGRCSVVITISPADITSVNMNSRAAGDNSIFSVIDDVNVK